MNTLQAKKNMAHAAGVLLIIVSLTNYLYWPLIGMIKPFHSIEQVNLWTYFILPISKNLLGIISLGLLMLTKPNKPTRLAIYIILLDWVVGAITDVSYYFAYCTHDISYLLHDIPYYISFALCVFAFYPYSLICRNNDMDKRDITWINLYLIGNIMSALFFIIRMIGIYCDYFTVNEAFFGEHIHWSNTALYNIFKYGFMVLILVAHWRYTHSAAFLGDYRQRTPEHESYKPIGRYVVATVVSLALGTGIFFLAYHYAGPLLTAIG